jgi:ubiquinone/menaquinone biosynthesis C-methylase UbiE
MKRTSIDYDQAAAAYAAHRRIHGPALEELCRRSGLGPGHTALEVGCGTGNYIRALVAQISCTGIGLDPSAGMLDHARAQGETVGWLQGQGVRPALRGDSVDLVFSVDVIHHLLDRAAYYAAVSRILRPGGLVCTVTDSEEIIRRREILSGYFPDTVEKEIARYPRIGQLEGWMADAGLGEASVVMVEEPYEISNAWPYRERAYSSLHLISEQAWQEGMHHLERDLSRGPVHGVSRYACVWGWKQQVS